MVYWNAGDINKVAKKIAVPTKEWAGNCYSIADMILKAGYIPDGKLRYGLWLGPVARGTMFQGRKIIHHGWIEYDDTSFGCTVIVDPTRWVFEAKKPYIYQAPDFDGYYDRGGNTLLMGTMVGRKPPRNDGSKQQIPVPKDKVGAIIRQLLGDYEGDTICWKQAGHIANQPLQFLGGEEKAIFTWLAKHGQKVLVPIDNWNYVMKG